MSGTASIWDFRQSLEMMISRLEIGVPLPMPATVEAVELVAARSANIQQRYSVPFLLENPAHYFSRLPADRRSEMSTDS